MSREENRYLKDPVAFDAFLRTHSDLIEKYIALQRSEDCFRLPVRREIAVQARKAFGYSPCTSNADIAYRIVTKFKKTRDNDPFKK
jgi:hypothetical protein